MASLLNRARMSTATTGTGTVTLASAVTGYASFAEAGAVNATVYSYCIEDGDDFEIGVGTYTSSGTTFSRDTVTLSKIGGASGTTKISLSGSAEIFITLRSADLGTIANGGTGATDAATAFANLKQAATTSATGVVEKAVDSEVRSATADKFISADLIESASAFVTLTDAATVALDWDAGINFSIALGGDRVLGNPTNGQPGTWRTVYVAGDGGGARALTFGNQYLNVVPTITDATSSHTYLLTIMCITPSIFVVTAIVAIN